MGYLWLSGVWGFFWWCSSPCCPRDHHRLPTWTSFKKDGAKATSLTGLTYSRRFASPGPWPTTTAVSLYAKHHRCLLGLVAAACQSVCVMYMKALNGSRILYHIGAPFWALTTNQRVKIAYPQDQRADAQNSAVNMWGHAGLDFHAWWVSVTR